MLRQQARMKASGLFACGDGFQPWLLASSQASQGKETKASQTGGKHTCGGQQAASLLKDRNLFEELEDLVPRQNRA